MKKLLTLNLLLLLLMSCSHKRVFADWDFNKEKPAHTSSITGTPVKLGDLGIVDCFFIHCKDSLALLRTNTKKQFVVVNITTGDTVGTYLYEGNGPNEMIDPRVSGFIDEMPEYFTRMNAVRRQVEGEGIEVIPLVMDTKFASIAGMCYDEVASKLNSFVVIDIGNGHTTAASIENGKIHGVFEHHTSSLTGESLERYIKRLASGEITHEEVYNDHGHGAHVLNPISELEKVIVSGPKRELIEKTNLDWHHAAPGGDVMMTGTVGLIKTIQDR